MTAEALREWLRVRKFSKAALARRLGVNWRTVHRWCAGQSAIPFDLELPAIPARPPGRRYVARVWVPERGRFLRRVLREPR